MATASTCTLHSHSTTTLWDGARPHPHLKSSAPHCVTLPTLLPPLPSIAVPRKAIGYSHRIARNVAMMATGDYMATAESTAEVTTEPAEAGNIGTGESTVNAESTTEVTTEMPDIVKTVQNVWDKVENKYEVSALVFAGFVALWGTAGMISAIDRLPLVPSVLELVGIGYTGWFAYRNLVSKIEREALIDKIKCTYGDII